MEGLVTCKRYILNTLDKAHCRAFEVDLSILYLAVLIIEAEDAKSSIFLHERGHGYDLQPVTI